MPENSKQRNNGPIQEGYPRKGGYSKPTLSPSANEPWKPP